MSAHAIGHVHESVQTLANTMISFPVPRKGKEMQANPAPSAIKETSFVYQKDKRGFLVFIGSVWYNHLKKTQTAERLNRKEETHGS